jgi:hypothetical protein
MLSGKVSFNLMRAISRNDSREYLREAALFPPPRFNPVCACAHWGGVPGAA